MRGSAQFAQAPDSVEVDCSEHRASRWKLESGALSLPPFFAIVAKDVAVHPPGLERHG